MAIINPDYYQWLKTNPSETVAVIVRTKNNPMAHTARLSELGLAVTRTFSLIPALALRGPAQGVLTLTQESWVETIEPDQPVETS